MTVSYRPTPNSQEPEPQRHGTQQMQSSETKPGSAITGNPQPLPSSIRRKVVGKLPVKPPEEQPTLRQPVTPKSANTSAIAPQEIENGNIILYRSSNFFLRTAYRPGQKQNPLRKPNGNTIVTPKVMPHQETRIADSDTHLMPNVKLNTAKQTRAIPMPAWLEAILVVLGLATAFVFHAYNIFNYPRYELDEGTYISNAWAIT